MMYNVNMGMGENWIFTPGTVSEVPKDSIGRFSAPGATCWENGDLWDLTCDTTDDMLGYSYDHKG